MTHEDDANGSQKIDQADHHKHMDYVQGVITRLANNSFVVKGWALTLCSALLGFAVSQGQAGLAWVAVGPVLIFWLLDTYFLRQERAFRNMFEDVAAKRVSNFEIKPMPYAKQHSWIKVGKSLSLSTFYGGLLILNTVIALTLVISGSAGGDPGPQDRDAKIESPSGT